MFLEEEKTMKRYLFGFATVLAAAGVTSLITARRIEAQYSSPVKVVNTTSAPAIASLMDDPGRSPYQSTMFNNTCTGFNQCTFLNFAPVPAGHRLVITRITADFLIGPTAADTSLTVFLQGGSGTTGFLHVWNPQVLNQNPVLSQSVTAYVDAGQTFFVSAQLGSGPFQSGSPTFDHATVVTVTGYMLDCTSAPCAPIAH
jgi:hypothetical protein